MLGGPTNQLDLAAKSRKKLGCKRATSSTRTPQELLACQCHTKSTSTA
jgi:hypothetical protein